MREMIRKSRRIRYRGRNRVVELNYIIRFKPEHLERVLKGSKRVTLRLGITRPRFREFIIACGSSAYGIGEIECVDIVRLEEIPQHIITEEGFKSRDELIRALKQLYPEIRNSSFVTIIRFNVKKIFSKPKPLIEAVQKFKEGQLDLD